MKNIDSSMVFECDIEDLKFPEIRNREAVMTSMEISSMMNLCESPYIGDDTRELLERDLESLRKKFDFIMSYPEKKD
jgi:hypothetical protein